MEVDVRATGALRNVIPLKVCGIRRRLIDTRYVSPQVGDIRGV